MPGGIAICFARLQRLNFGLEFDIIKQIRKCFKILGYNANTSMLKAEFYGVPQERRRLFFIGNRIGNDIVFPKPAGGNHRREYR
ncbi:MAG: DNA cytosine methyltransferase [Clostridiales Family XIII bacterium]|nr:DNA cytosine methyltransferase [Clostridiales Family XIII bacterium]